MDISTRVFELRRTGADGCSDVYESFGPGTPYVKRRTQVKAALCGVLLIVAVICLPARSLGQSSQPSDWQQIDADSLFTFRLPQGFTKTDMAGVEHYLGEYYKDKTRFLFISGDSASDGYDVRRQPDMEDYQETETRIGGKPANIRAYSKLRDGARIYRAELNIGNWEKGDVELYMEVESSSFDDIKMAKQIFDSIKFSTQKAIHSKN